MSQYKPTIGGVNNSEAASPAVIMASSQQESHAMSAVAKYSRLAAAGGICASSTHLVTVPMDVVKTRLQVATPGQYPGGASQLTSHIRATQGWKGLTVGWAPTTVGYMLQGACKFGIYEYLKDEASANLSAESLVKYKLPIYATASALAEMVGSTLLCPWEAVRIRQVSKPDYAPNMMGVMRRMHREEGFGGLYRGLVPILGKQVPYTMTQLVSFQYVTEAMYGTVIPKVFGITKDQMSSQSQLAVSAGSGVAAGVISAICSHPPDTVLSRINMAHKAGNAAPSIGAIVQELGFMGLWKGIGLRCAMVGTISAGMFLIFDGVKVMTGLPTTQGIVKK